MTTTTLEAKCSRDRSLHEQYPKLFTADGAYIGSGYMVVDPKAEVVQQLEGNRPPLPPGYSGKTT